MQDQPEYDDAVEEIRSFFDQQKNELIALQLPAFGSIRESDLELLEHNLE